MDKKFKYISFSLFAIIYSALIIYNFSKAVGWVYDSIIALIFLIFLLFVSDWLFLSKTGFVLANSAMLMHNLGTFGFYSFNIGILQYDNLVHFTSSAVAAYILFEFILRRVCIKDDEKTFIDEHKAIIFFLVIASVAMLGTLVELIEYTGFVYFGEGDGLLFSGEGDINKFGDIDSQYSDTMDDIFTNTLGSIIGLFFYYFIRYNKNQKPFIT